MKKSYEDELFEAVLKVALKRKMEEEYENMPSPEESNEKHPSSLELDKRIYELIRSHEKKGEKESRSRKIVLVMKVVTSITVALVVLFGSVYFVSADVRKIVHKLVYGESNAVVSVGEDIRISEKQSESDFTRPVYIPAGFEIVEETSTSIQDRITYGDGEKCIYFRVNDTGLRSFAFDTEWHDVVEGKLLDGAGIFVIAKEEGEVNYVLGVLNEKEFLLESTISIDELEKMANSML